MGGWGGEECSLGHAELETVFDFQGEGTGRQWDIGK